MDRGDLVGYSTWGRKKLDMAERLTLCLFTDLQSTWFERGEEEEGQAEAGLLPISYLGGVGENSTVQVIIIHKPVMTNLLDTHMYL